MQLKIFLIILINYHRIWAQANVPPKQEANLQPITDAEQKSKISLNEPNSQRSDFLYFDPTDGRQNVKGSFNTYFADTMTDLIVDYVADINGYRASFKIFKSLPPGGVSFETRLSNNSLKSLAG